MKFTILTILLLSALYIKAEEIKTTIKDVMVYQKGAMIERKGTIRINQGISTFYLTGLSSALEPNTIRVAIQNPAITLVSINHEFDYNEDPTTDKAKTKLEQRCSTLRDSIAVLQNQVEVLENEKSLILDNKKMGGEKGITATELSAMAVYFRKELTEVGNRILKLNKQIDNYQKELLLLIQKKQNTQQEGRKLISKVKVVVSADANATSEIKVSYLVLDVAWQPFYEIRIKEANQPLQLVYSAKINQNTKEDWHNVHLTLSTGNPSVSNERPPFEPIYLPYYHGRSISFDYTSSNYANNMIQGYVRNQQGEALVGASITAGEVECKSDMNGYFKLQLKGENTLRVSYIGYQTQSIKASPFMNIALDNDNRILEEVALAGGSKKGKMQNTRMTMVADKDIQIEENCEYSENQAYISMNTIESNMAIEFDIEIPYNIPANGKDYDVRMLEYQIPAEYQYSIVPRYSEDIYLMARIVDWNQYHLLPGNSDLFIKNVYQGASSIFPDATQDTLALSIGRDKDIAVSREEVRNYTSRSLIGSTRKVQKCWKITVKNNKEIPIEVEVEDQYPVAQRDDIKVTLLESSNAIVEAKTGKLTWKVKLAPNSKQEITFSYEVKYPNSYSFLVD